MRTKETVTSSNQRYGTFSCVISFLLILLVFTLIPPASAANELSVTLTSNPPHYTPGETCTLTILVTYSSSPVSGATAGVVSPAAGVSFSPATGTTDSAGLFVTILSVPVGTSGPITVNTGVGITGSESYESSTLAGSGSLVIPMKTVTTPVYIPQPVVQQPPVAALSVDRNYCTVPCTIAFSGAGSHDPDGTIAAYQWSFGDGTTGTGEQVSHVYSSTGSYSTVLTVTDTSGLSSSGSVKISTRGGMTAPVVAGANTPPVAVMNAASLSPPDSISVTFDGQDSYDPDGAITSYAWDFGDGETGTGSLVTHTFMSAGVYPATLTVTDDSGLSQSLTSSVSVSEDRPVMTPAPVLSPLPATPAPTIQAIPGDLSGSTQSEVSALSITDVIHESRTGISAPPLLAGIFPAGIMPILAIIFGITALAVPVILARAGAEPRITRFQDDLQKFIQKIGLGHLIRYEDKLRNVHVSDKKPVPAWIAPRDILVIVTSILFFVAAFYIQTRMGIDILTLLTLLIMAASAVILHDLAHAYAATRFGSRTEFRFWEIGAVTMILTAMFFGATFAKPSRTVVDKPKERSTREIGIISLAGPMVNVVVAVISIGLIAMGGPFAFPGKVGLFFNLVACVYALVPIKPMDGIRVYHWNRGIWATIFIPLLVAYLWLFMG